MSNDQLALSRWAQAYEEKHGKVFCAERQKNNQERDQGRWRTDDSATRAETYAQKKAQSDQLWREYRAGRDALKDGRKQEYDALWQQRGEDFAAQQAEVKGRYKPEWRETFKRQRGELRQFDSSMTARLKFVLTHYETGKLKAIVGAVLADREVRAAYLRTQESERQELGDRQKQDIAAAAIASNEAWRIARDQLNAQHQAEDEKRRSFYKSATDDVWKKNITTPAAEAFQRNAAPEQDNGKAQAETLKETWAKRRERDQTRTRKPRPR